MSQDLTILGVKTPKVVIYKSESQKLCQAFTVKAGDVINTGAPVKLNADGTISPYYGVGIYLGIATQFSSNAPYPHKEVTVMVEAFAVVYGVSKTALDAGYVVPESAVENTQFTKYAVSAGGTPAPTNFLCLTVVDGADELIQVLIK